MSYYIEMKFLYNICLFIAIQILLSNQDLSFIYSIMNSLFIVFNSNSSYYDIMIVIFLYLDSYLNLNYTIFFLMIYEILPLIDISIYIITLISKIQHYEEN